MTNDDLFSVSDNSSFADHAPKQRICIVTDAWQPQVNGVVRTLESLRRELCQQGYQVLMLTPKLFKTMPLPTYPEIRLSLNIPFRLAAMLEGFKPEAIHIATEGPLGWAARRYCRLRKIGFTTAYHTAFPEYISARSALPANWFYPIFRRFHAPSQGVLVATSTVRDQLAEKGFDRLVPWTRGVDTSLFYPRAKIQSSYSSPVQLYVGRIAVEKNIEAFLEADVPGTKLVVGEGPAKSTLSKKYPAAKFLGSLFGHDLAEVYAAADVFVFPSKTDTFGLVMIEALASGTPVAAYPVQGPIDVLGPDGRGPFGKKNSQIASLKDNLAEAIREALTLDRKSCANFAQNYSWKTVAHQFVAALQMIPSNQNKPAPFMEHMVSDIPADIQGNLSEAEGGTNTNHEEDSGKVLEAKLSKMTTFSALMQNHSRNTNHRPHG